MTVLSQTPPRVFTPEDLLSMPDGDRYELVDGRLVERAMGFESSWIGGRVFSALSAHCDARSLGWVLPADASYQCFPDASDKVRKPDVSFINRGRLPDERPPTGHCRIAPDLAVEVISPNDLFAEVGEKVQEYLEAGVRLVWVVNPSTRFVHVHRPDGRASDLSGDDQVSGEDVVDGFSCRVADLFQSPVKQG